VIILSYIQSLIFKILIKDSKKFLTIKDIQEKIYELTNIYENETNIRYNLNRLVLKNQITKKNDTFDTRKKIYKSKINQTKIKEKI